MNKLLTTLLMTFPFSAFAQDNDPATITYSRSNVRYADTAARSISLETRIRIPIYRKDRNLLAAGVGYRLMKLDNFPAGYAPTLHGFTLQGIWQHTFDSRRNIAFFAQGALFSDMKDIGGKDLRFGGGFRFRFIHNDKWSTGWGLVYARQFFGNQIVPFIDIDFKPGAKWSITGQFPVKPKILYHCNDRWRIGMEWHGEVSSFRMSARDNNRVIQVNQWTSLARTEYSLSGSWQLFAAAGTNLKQSYRLYEDVSRTSWTIITIPIGQKPPPVQKIDAKGWIVQFGLSYYPFRHRPESDRP